MNEPPSLARSGPKSTSRQVKRSTLERTLGS